MRESNKAYIDYSKQKNLEQKREKEKKIANDQENAIKNKEREDKRKYEDDVRKYNKLIKDLKQLIKDQESQINSKMNKLKEKRALKSESLRNAILDDLQRLMAEKSSSQADLDTMNEHLTNLMRDNITSKKKL